MVAKKLKAAFARPFLLLVGPFDTSALQERRIAHDPHTKERDT